jgi:hypothetical protein
MIVPEFWAEAKESREINGRNITIRRFGWSDLNVAAAQEHAETRLKAALENSSDAKHLLKREPKVPYNGAEGVPIREEIIQRHEDTIITRNSYGALCLNTPDVLFGDMDYEEQGAEKMGFIVFAVLLAIIGVAVFTANLPKIYFFLAVFAFPLTNFVHRIFSKKDEQQYQEKLQLIRSLMDKRPDWRLRIYKTPRGIRLLALHKTFDPRSDEVTAFFAALGVDKIFQKMCANQNCFRARVSPKPWRIGIEGHLRPRPGTWPIAPDKLHLRERWVSEYERKSAAYAACKFVEEIGAGNVHPKAIAVQTLHDDYCKALSDLPIA